MKIIFITRAVLDEQLLHVGQTQYTDLLRLLQDIAYLAVLQSYRTAVST